jgi:hypothetical protein
MLVHYPAPVFPGERVELKNTFKATEGAVQREGADHVFVEKMNMGGKPTAVSYSLMLPQGAKVVSTKPESNWRCEVNGRSVLNFKWTEKEGTHPELRVKYSVPAS